MNRFTKEDMEKAFQAGSDWELWSLRGAGDEDEVPYFDQWIENEYKCAITDNNGNHCPEKPKHEVVTSGKESVMLCDRCYRNYKDGAYNK